MNLADFLAEASRTRFAWGRHDCCLWLADWLVAQGRPDPAAHLRGRYSTRLGAARALNREGGLQALIAAAAQRAGLPPTEAPETGDVAVVEAPTPNGLAAVCAIRAGARWAMLGEAGLVVGPARLLAAWRVA